MNTELKAAMEALEKEKNISQDVLFDAIEQALVTACKNNFGRTENIKVEVDRDTFEFHVWAEKTIVPSKEDVTDPQLQISADDAKELHITGEPGDVVRVDLNDKAFGRIATQAAKNVIIQKIREEERNSLFNQYDALRKQVVTGVVQREIGTSWSVNLGRTDGILNEKEQIKGEVLRPNERLKVFVLDVRRTQKGGTRILLSRTHPDLVKKLFEEEVSEIHDGIVEIKSIAREAGSRTKIAVWSNNPNVDPVGACVGLNGSRVNNIVDELNGEKIDIVNWDENPGNLIQNALSPAKIVAVFADPEEKSAKVVVPDYQLSLAIGREGQNARLAAKLTGYKIDIKNETQAKVTPGFRYEDYMMEEEGEEGDEVEYVDENGNPVDVNGNPLGTEPSPEDEDVEIEYVDENGNPVDANGNPLEPADDEEPETEEDSSAAEEDKAEDTEADADADTDTDAQAPDEEPAEGTTTDAE